MEIQYIGEQLLPGYLGRFALILAFISALFAAFSYWQASNEKRPDFRHWRDWGRNAYRVHSFMIILASAALFYILLNRLYEYRYAWIHTENDLGLGYLISSFWAGQEGSFLFWTLCQVIFGLLLIRFDRNWEPPVMTIMAVSQVFMVSMMLGFRFGDLTIGMNPFILLREASENIDNHFFHNPNYLAMITDGNGLNPLLRNFWMLSHPPVTFIGYAAVLVPFCYALAGLWKKKYHEWIRAALPWTSFGLLSLGAGILLGGVWAYESLTFGGFWAWDPIENASLVPWLVLVAALHLMLVSRKKRNTYFPTFLFTILAFVLVIYATYLTRSGVLSDTSVHSFGSDGMGRHILVYLYAFLITGLVLLGINYKHLPSKDTEEPFTREFWLFIGALVLVLSAFQVIFSTSMPVMNKMFGTDFAPPLNVVEYYNNWQLPFAVVIGLLIGFTHFIKWGRNDLKRFFGSVGLSLILALAAVVLVTVFSDIQAPAHLLMAFASLFALFSSLDLVFRFKGQYAKNGAIVSHLGIGLFMFAVVLTFSQKETISKNTSGYFLGENFSETENLLLIKGEILPMGEFYVSYVGHQKEGDRLHYQVDFLKKNREGDYYKVFTSYPSILLNERMGNVYEPYAKVYPGRDIFTYITFADLERPDDLEDYTLIETLEIAVNDTLEIGNNQLVLNNLQTPSRQGEVDPDDIRITARMEVITHFGRSYEVNPSFILKDGYVSYEDDAARDLDLRFRFSDVTDKPFTIELEVFEERTDFIIIKTIIFPFINLLWLSIIVMMAGFWITFRYRWKRREREPE